MAHKGEIIVGLDIGTTKVRAVVGEVFTNEIQIIGLGEAKSTGIKKGAIVDINATVSAIKKAVEEAEIMSDYEVSDVYAGIAGQYINGYSGSGVIMTNPSEITKDDIERVVDQATGLIKSKALQKDSDIIHVLPQEFIVNEQYGIKNPVGMAGGTLEVKIHVVSGPRSFIQNMAKCVNIAGLEIKKLVLESLAAADAVLTKDEKDDGVALIDIGGNSSDMSIFSDGNIQYTYVLPIGGQHLTKDISVVMNTPFNEAEELKTRYGECISEKIAPEEQISVPSLGRKGANTTHRQILVDIIEKRTEEIFSLLHEEIYRAGMEDKISSGIVLTGGTANMKGIVELAESIFNAPVRIGSPDGNISGLNGIINNPEFATVTGLIKYGAQNIREPGNTKKNKSSIGNFIQQIINWFK